MTWLRSRSFSRGNSWWPTSTARRAVWLLTLSALPCCKTGDTGPQTGSESHFLERCSNECGDGLSCLCGTCTKACTGTDECKVYGSEAECVPVAGQPSTDAAGACRRGATCDMSCLRDGECASLGADYRCESGFCRTGAAVCPVSVLTPGDSTREVLVGDTVRSYLLHVPAGYAGTAPVPLVLDFHPMSLGASWEKSSSGFLPLSDREGFIVAWPQGTETSWNVGPCCTTSKDVDDLGFARAIVRQLSTDACIDPARVHAVGYSMGGFMAYYLACTQSEIFASIAVSSMDLFVDDELPCQPRRAVAEISFRSTADTVVPYGGGVSSPPGRTDLSANLLGAEKTFQRWAAIDKCKDTASAPDAQGCRSYSQCDDGVTVTLCTSDSGQPYAGQVIGDAGLAWDMLKRHPMP